MTEDKNQQPPEKPSERIRKAFEFEFERFSDSPETLLSAEDQLKKLQDLKVKFLGKKSELATQKKMIGNIDPKSRRDFALTFQNLERHIEQAIDDKRLRLENIVRSARVEQASIDVTHPS